MEVSVTSCRGLGVISPSEVWIMVKSNTYTRSLAEFEIKGRNDVYPVLMEDHLEREEE